MLEDNQGEILPPGWFAYGINGTCPATGHQLKQIGEMEIHADVAWGNGNSVLT